MIDIYNDQAEKLAEWPTVRTTINQEYFVDYGFKVIESINRNVMLLQQFLSAIRQILSKFFIFQQDSARPQSTWGNQRFPHNFAKCWAALKFFQNRLSSKFVVK